MNTTHSIVAPLLRFMEASDDLTVPYSPPARRHGDAEWPGIPALEAGD